MSRLAKLGLLLSALATGAAFVAHGAGLQPGAATSEEERISSCRLYPLNARMLALDLWGAQRHVLYAAEGKADSWRSFRGDCTAVRRADGAFEARFEMNGPVSAVFRDGMPVSWSRPTWKAAADVKPACGNRLTRKRRGAFLWARSDRSKDGKRYWAGSGRLRLFYNNPNAAGALFAELGALLCWMLLFSRGRIWRIGSAALSCAVLVLLLETGSRGSFVAFLASGIVLLQARFRLRLPSLRRKRTLVAIAVGLAVLAGVVCSFGGRFGRGLFEVDEGNRKRLSLWAAAPQMMAAAPGGWKAPTGYVWGDWYQRLDDDFCTTWMVNSHLSWLTANGCGFRIAYLGGWALLFLVLFRNAKDRSCALACGEWICLFVCMWFSSVGFAASLWLLPGASALPLAARGVRAFVRSPLAALRRWSAPVAVSALAGALALAGLLALGRKLEGMGGRACPIRRAGSGIVVGHGEPKACLVHDGFVLTGNQPGTLGKALRRHYGAHPEASAVYVTETFDGLPEAVDRLVLAGRRCADYVRLHKTAEKLPCRARETVFLSPPFAPGALPRSLAGSRSVRLIYGSLHADCLQEAGRLPKWVEVVPGAALYVPDWIERTMP